MPRPPRKSQNNARKGPPPPRQQSRPPARRAETGANVTLEITDMAQGGLAIGRTGKERIFLPYAIPGEQIEAQITSVTEKAVFAEGVRLLDASGDRVKPRCEHFGRCWGCQWQHIDYGAQVVLKFDVLADQLGRAGKMSDPLLSRVLKHVIPSPQHWGYNWRMMFIPDDDGHLALHTRDGRTLEQINTCHILHPDLLALYDSLEMDFSDAKRVHLLRGEHDEMMLVLEMANEIMPALTSEMRLSINVILPDREPLNLVGDTNLTYVLNKIPLRVTVGSPFRANIAQTARLAQEVVRLARLTGSETVLDAYAGVGVFAAHLARHAAHVTVIESYPPAASDAEVNLEMFEEVTIVEGTVEDTLESMIDSEMTFDVGVIDPPSTGLSEEARQQLAATCGRIIYVSSNPLSFARDATYFMQNGFALTQIQPLDFAPHTYYVETVAVLEKR